MKSIDVFTDGSHCIMGYSTWGFLINQKDPILISGRGISSFKSSAELEALAVLKALLYIRNQNLKNIEVNVHSDCLCISNMSAKNIRKKISSKFNNLLYIILDQINQLKEELKLINVIVRVYYIPAHKMSETSHNICNRVIDLHVRKVLRKIRKKDQEKGRLFLLKKKFMDHLFSSYEINFASKNPFIWESLPGIKTPSVMVSNMITASINDVSKFNKKRVA